MQRNIESFRYNFLIPLNELGPGFPTNKRPQVSSNYLKGHRKSLVHNKIVVGKEFIIHLSYYW